VTSASLRRRLSALAVASAVVLLAACSISKDEKGGKKNVDIKTPFGSVQARNDADSRDTGMAVYPGARPLKKEGEEDKTANVNISTSLFGVKVVVASFESDDSPEKLLSYYRNELKKWGNVVECPGGGNIGGVSIHSKHGDEEVSCGKGKPDGGNVTELKVGTENRQHVVAVKPRGKGSEFSLVYVQARGKEETI
jgi:hypothetical protein